VLLAELGLAADAVVFETLSGALSVERDGAAYRMDFPAQPPRRVGVPDGLPKALGSEPVEVWASAFLVVLLQDEAAVRRLQPNLAALEQISSSATQRGNVGVAALADPGRDYDVVDRFFAPGFGIPEDPATGSLHTILSPLFADKLDRSKVTFHQAYPRRGANLIGEVRGNRVLLGGRAVTVMDSVLRF
jgi:predicted PhzF superfamily epimerase YddE/YHI9